MTLKRNPELIFITIVSSKSKHVVADNGEEIGIWCSGIHYDTKKEKMEKKHERLFKVMGLCVH